MRSCYSRQFVFFCSVALFISGINAEAAKGVFFKRHIRLTNQQPLSRQVNKKGAIYIVNNSIDLGGETVTMPDDAILSFENGGMLCNGKLLGNFGIRAAENKVFDKVNLSSYNSYDHSFKISWIIGERRKLYTADFTVLPRSIVDFEGEFFEAGEELKWDQMEGFHFVNLNLRSSFPIHFWYKALAEFNCAPLGSKEGYQGKIKARIPSNFNGCLVEITTADRTRYDYRPDDNGVPSLYRGITSQIINIEGEEISIRDKIEFFSESRKYNQTMVYSKCRVIRPVKFIISNCHFVFLDKAGISLRGYDFLIEDSSFEALDGANSLVSLGGYKGRVTNCIVKGASYPGTHTSYGIQVVKGTGITIENCSFYENRRSVDFSGGYESRYNEVRHCYFYQDSNGEKTGSAMGGHSTSFGNVFRNNTINGEFQIGIQCRGEEEIIEGNIFNCTASTLIVFAFNTQILRNKVITPGKYAVGVFASSGIQDEGNTLLIIDNDIELRKVLVNGDSGIFYDIRDNKVHFSPNASSIKPVMFSRTPIYYRLEGNELTCSRQDTRVRLIENGEIIL